MKKTISFVGLFAVIGVGISDAHGVAMSAQVRRLLQEKQEKIEQLEKCEGKKQGWMIAGISTIGLTAVGVGVNIAQASKSNRLSSEIEMEKGALEKQQNELNQINKDIANEQLRQRREECEKQPGRRWNNNGYCEDIPSAGGQSGGGSSEGGSSNGNGGSAGKYDDYKLTCDTVRFTFDKVDDYSAVLASLNAECQRVMERNMVNLTELGLGGSDASKVVFECSGYKESITCKSNGGIVLNGGVIGQPCAEGIENIANSKFTGVWTREDKGQYTCHATANDNLPIPCVCKKQQDGNGGNDGNDVSGNETSLQKCLRERSGDKVGTACCYLSKSVATYENGQCVCAGGKEFSIGTDGHGKCSGKGGKKDCPEGQVRIGGKGNCVKADYTVTHGYANTMCKCKDGSTNCTLVKDEKGSSVCQYGEGEGEKCSCVEKKPSSPEKPEWKLPQYDPYNTSGECKGEFGDKVTTGCVCKADKGLVSRFSGPRGYDICDCPNGKRWESGQDKCVDIKAEQPKQKKDNNSSTPTYQLPSYGMDDYLKYQESNKKQAEKKQETSQYQIPSYGMDDYLKYQESNKTGEKQPVAQGYENPFRIGLPDK